MLLYVSVVIIKPVIALTTVFSPETPDEEKVSLTDEYYNFICTFANRSVKRERSPYDCQFQRENQRKPSTFVDQDVNFSDRLDRWMTKRLRTTARANMLQPQRFAEKKSHP